MFEATQDLAQTGDTLVFGTQIERLRGGLELDFTLFAADGTPVVAGEDFYVRVRGRYGVFDEVEAFLDGVLAEPEF